ncbi:AAA family ATPase [Kordia sp. TARA_039_SRF]|nr:AAA family ATPase [Kordia sp. TARA_039_SRF]
MNYTYDIHLPKDENSSLNNYYTSDDLENSIEHLKNLNKINIFVGANNSGKSRFMRELMTYDTLFGVNDFYTVNETFEKYLTLLKVFNFQLVLRINTIQVLRKINKLKVEEFDLKDGSKLMLNLPDWKGDYEKSLDYLRKNIETFKKIVFLFDCLKDNWFGDAYRNSFRNLNPDFFKDRIVYLSQIEKLQQTLVSLLKKQKRIDGNKIYIPILRTAHSLFKQKENNSSSFKKIRDDIFLDTARKNYEKLKIISHEERKERQVIQFQKGITKAYKRKIDVFTGMNLYNEIVNVRNSKREKRERFLQFEKFLSINFFESKTVDIVADFNMYRRDADIEEDDSILVLIGETTRKLHELGDGVQALIILMYKVFLADNDSVIFIDEPEINLHPGYQRLFLEQITRNKELTDKNLTYIVVTHSNHFLDLTLEKDNVSIYSFSSLLKKENEQDKFMIRNVNAGDNELLRDLGVNNSSVFLANCSIWVEGISDRNFIKAFLEAYCLADKKKVLPREDIDFAFFEYAGTNLTHYDFRGNTSDGQKVKDLINTYALNNRIFLLSDLDEGKETKHNTLREIVGKNENFIYKTTKPYREIENLLSNEVWRKVLIEFWNKNKIKEEELKDKVQDKINNALTKNKSQNYSKDYIGKFLKTLSLDGLNKIWEEDSERNPKTFKYKAKLSEIVLKKVRDNEITWEDFSKNKTIVDLTEAIYNFIKNKQ